MRAIARCVKVRVQRAHAMPEVMFCHATGDDSSFHAYAPLLRFTCLIFLLFLALFILVFLKRAYAVTPRATPLMRYYARR